MNPVSAQRARQRDDPNSSDHSKDSSEELVVTRNPANTNGRHSMGAKLGHYDGNTGLQTFLARFDNFAEYFDWDDSDKLFQLRASLIGAAGKILWDAGNSRSWVKSSLCSRFVSEARIEPNDSVPNCGVESGLRENHCKNSARTSVV